MNFLNLIIFLIKSATGHDSVVNYKKKMLYFDFCNWQIVIPFSCVGNKNDSRYSIDPLDNLNVDEFCINYTISGLYISTTAILSEQDDEEIYSRPYYSEMLYCVKQINKNYSDAIEDYIVDTYDFDDCGYGMGCSTYEYGYRIVISSKYWFDKEFLSYMIDDLFEQNISSKVWRKYKLSFFDISDCEDINIITTNTKTRRLGYIKYLISQFTPQRYFTKQILLNKVEKDVEKLESDLLLHKNTKGLVQKKGLSASVDPYFDLACSMHLTQKINNGYELTKLGIVYEKLLNNPLVKKEGEEENVFVLDIIDKSIFLETILENDYLFTFIILEYAYTAERPSYKQFKLLFKTKIINHIDKIIKTACFSKEISRNRLNEIKKRIQAWGKAEIYMEHVLMPRLNWLYDLDIIILNNDSSFMLTPHGEILLNILSSFNATNGGYIINPDKYLKRTFMQLLTDVYTINGIINQEQQETILCRYIKQCFEIFKTLAPNRVTYSVMTAYVKRLALFNEHIIIEEKDINEFLLNNPNKYIFKYQKHYQDGYVQLKK